MKFKNLLPFENYVLTTKLPVDEILKRIQDNTELKQSFSFATMSRNYTKPYTGKVVGASFTMSRNINYRNSWADASTYNNAADYFYSDIYFVLAGYCWTCMHWNIIGSNS